MINVDYCDELDRLLEAHSELTLEFVQQDGRTQDFFATDDEWAAECLRLQALEQQLGQVTADVVDHRRLHHCGSRPKANA
jgi:hypothetical protein